MSIKSYRDEGTREIASQVSSKISRKILPNQLHPLALEKLVLLDSASELRDLFIWSSLRLEKLKGERAGQYSIRINNQYRICFFWRNGDAYEVEIVDYH